MTEPSIPGGAPPSSPPAWSPAMPAPYSPAPVAPAVPSRGGLVEWLTLRGRLADARARHPTPSPEEEGALRAGRAAAELADRVLEAADPLRVGPAPWLATVLYAESARHLLSWKASSSAPLESAWRAADGDEIAFAAGGAERAPRLLHVLTTAGDRTTLALDAQIRDALEAKAFVDALLARREIRDREVGSLLWTRAIRLLTLVVLAAMIAAGVNYGLTRMRRNSDLANGKPWKTSSTYPGFNAQTHVVDANTTTVLFHTNEEVDAWFEIDLGAPTKIGSVELVNRDDCCGERAIPLVIETSLDHAAWSEAARRTDPFQSFIASFAKRDARWVRVRTLRKTWLHLDRVAVYAK